MNGKLVANRFPREFVKERSVDFYEGRRYSQHVDGDCVHKESMENIPAPLMVPATYSPAISDVYIRPGKAHE